MECPKCRATLPDDLLQCTNCAADVSFMVTTPQGTNYGPYSLQSLRQYVAEGRIPPGSQASQGGGPPVPVEQVGAAPPAPAPSPPATPPAAPRPPTATGAAPGQPGGLPPGIPAAPLPPEPISSPGVYRGNAAAAQAPIRRAKKKGVSCWLVGGIIAAIVLIFGGLLVFAVFAPVFSKARGKAIQTNCGSNLKQISLAMLMFAQDNNQTLPDPSNFREQIKPFMGPNAEQLFTCPASGKGEESYEMNPNLAGASLTTINNPAQVPMVYDAGFPDGKGPHEGGWNVAFCDGHYKSVSQGEASQYQLEPY